MAVDTIAPPAQSDRTPAKRPRGTPIGPRLWHFASFGGPGVAIYVCFVLAPILISVVYSMYR